MGIRDGRGTVFLQNNWRLTDVSQVFNEAHRSELIQKIPEAERFNIYWTAAKCWEGAGRKLAEQDIIPFDIDKLNLPDTWTEEQCHTHAKQVARLVCEVLRVRYEDCGILFSGNGVWVIVRTTKPWSDPEYFEKTRIYYDDILKRINQLLRERGYEGTADSTGWGHGKLIRFPDTENVKKDKPRRYARVLNEHIRAIDWTIEEACPELKVFEQAETATNIPFSNPDVEGILTECKFLADRATDHASEPEYEWYARAGLYAFFPKGKDQLFHDHSKQYHGYSEYETNFKLEQARAAQKGPRLCDNIAKITNNKYCQQCKHYQQIKTPMQITSANFIKSESTGFWRFNSKGVPTTICFDDLIKAFSRDHLYTAIIDEPTIMVYNGTHWEEMPEQSVKAWMNERMNPSVPSHQTQEFCRKLREQPGKLKRRLDFDTGTYGKMNFKNCVLDFKTMQTSQHSPDYLFTYVLPYAYDPHAQAPTWEKFVADVTSNPEDALTLKEFAGWTISGDEVTKRGRALILVGTGSNGKSVYMDVLKTLLGKKNFTSKSLDALIHKQFTVYYIMYSLANITAESNPEVFKNTDVFKAMTNGDTITAEKKGGLEYDFEPRAKLICSMNHPFKVYDDSLGFRRRILFVPFNKTFVGSNDDKNIEAKLNKEIPGIINSVIKAYRNMLIRGEELGVGLPFSSIPNSENIMNELTYEHDSIAQFVENKCEKDTNHEEQTGTLHSAYTNYCKVHGIKNPKQIIAFVRDIKNKYPDLIHRKSNGKTFIKGLKLWEF